jgi:hypothetical protein
MEELIKLYGPYLAPGLIAVSWLANKVWPFLSEKVYANHVAREKEEREEKRRREEAEREERRQERLQLVELVKNNTSAMTQVTGAIDRLNDTVAVLSRDVLYIYTKLDLERPGEREKEV